MTQPLLVGNNFAVLVAASELASKGRPVTLVTDGRSMGGHFSGISLNGLDFDLGMVLYEKSCPILTKSNLCTYDPMLRNDWVRFGDRASEWIDNRVETVRTKTIECLVNGRRFPDYLIANRLDAFKGERAIEPIPRSNPRHAINKNKPGIYDNLTYAEATNWNHGKNLQDKFIEPFVRKVFSADSKDFLARYHRSGWLPLYYSETLSQCSLDLPLELPEYPFWTSPNGVAGQLVRNLVSILNRSKTVTLDQRTITDLSQKDGRWRVRTAKGGVYDSHLVGIGLPLDRVSQLLGYPLSTPKDSASVSLAFATIESESIKSMHACTMIVDEDFAAFRLIDHDSIVGSDTLLHRVVLEASPHRLASLYPAKTQEEALGYELAKLMGLEPNEKSKLKILKCVTAKNALSIPTPKMLESVSRYSSELRSMAGSARLTSNLLGFGVSSLNDQIIQGLQISEEFQ